jgi:hypothetical protein
MIIISIPGRTKTIHRVKHLTLLLDMDILCVREANGDIADMS